MSRAPTSTARNGALPGPLPGASAGAPAGRRVRHQMRDALLLMLFSAGASLGVATLMLVLLDTAR